MFFGDKTHLPKTADLLPSLSSVQSPSLYPYESLFPNFTPHRLRAFPVGSKV